MAFPPFALMAGDARRRPPFLYGLLFRPQPLRIKAQQAAARLEPEPRWQPNRKRGALHCRLQTTAMAAPNRRGRFANSPNRFARAKPQASPNGHEVASQSAR